MSADPLSLLDQAHRLALGARHHLDLDPAALVRSWPRITAAAAEVHARHHLGSSTGPQTAASLDRTFERAVLDSRCVAHDLFNDTWPGPGPGHPILERAAEQLEAAAAAPGPLPPVPSSTLMASLLWSTAELVRARARDHSIDLVLGPRPTDPAAAADRVAQAAAARDVAHRIGAIAQVAAGAVRARPFADRHGGQNRADLGTRLRQAVATWDVEAHRALLEARSTLVLHAVCRLEASATQGLADFVDEAAGHGLADNLAATRLAPVLRHTAHSWGALRETTGALSFGDRAIPDGLVEAASDLNTSLRDALHTPRDHEQSIATALIGHLASAIALAGASRGLLHETSLRAPARAVARTLADLDDATTASHVDPRAIQRGETIALPWPARESVDRLLASVLAQTSDAVQRTACLDGPTAARGSTPYRTGPAIAAHAHHHPATRKPAREAGVSR